MINVAKEKETAGALAAAFTSGNESEIKQAFIAFQNEIAEDVKAEMDESNDSTVLVQRGVRQLTSAEKKFYEGLINSAKASNPKQAFTDLLTVDGGMPETIIEDVFKDLTENHPLLAKINFRSVKYLTKWLLNDHVEDQAIWGEINSEITKQIESGFKALDITQGKLTAYIVIAKDMLDLGPVFVDAYVRAILKEVIALGLENGIINGTGVKGQPIGLVRDIHKGVSVDTENGYPEKAAIAVTDFTPASYGKLVGENLAKKENGKVRTINTLQMIVNPVDYLTKVMPATTLQNVSGEYKRDLFPIPTEVIQSAAVAEGKAILTVLPEYFFGIGASKEGQIEYSDEFQFLADTRVYKTKMYGAGRCEDNTSAVVLNIANLDPAYITVKHNDISA